LNYYEIITKELVFSLFKQIHFSDTQVTDAVIKLSEEVDARTSAEQQYKNASNIKSEFMANMSPDIRTKKYLEFAKLSSNILLVIMNDILDLNKIKSGKLVVKRTVFH
jgi:signal transduction histidine kinase